MRHVAVALEREADGAVSYIHSSGKDNGRNGRKGEGGRWGERGEGRFLSSDLSAMWPKTALPFATMKELAWTCCQSRRDRCRRTFSEYSSGVAA